MPDPWRETRPMACQGLFALAGINETEAGSLDRSPSVVILPPRAVEARRPQPPPAAHGLMAAEAARRLAARGPAEASP